MGRYLGRSARDDRVRDHDPRFWQSTSPKVDGEVKGNGVTIEPDGDIRFGDINLTSD